ncbi:hypothetical protein R3P38DRAFT_2365373, partial [Favolaschia claudopus]
LGLLAMYCALAYSTLQMQKSSFLYINPGAQYPCPASVFSAITIELGGPHFRTDHRGVPWEYEPASWAILTAIGNYRPVNRGHIIFWDFGLVVQFPPGATILIPPGLIRYSFVKVAEHHTRYSILQWAGAGIQRFLDNDDRTDLQFATTTTKKEHEGREGRRRRDHLASIGMFPFVDELREG